MPVNIQVEQHKTETCSQPSDCLPELRFAGACPPVLFLAVEIFAFLGEEVGGSEDEGGGGFRFPEAELLCTVCAIP